MNRFIVMAAATLLCGCNLFTTLDPVDSNNKANNTNNSNNSNNANNVNNLPDMAFADVEFTTDASFGTAEARVSEDLLLLYTFQNGFGQDIPDRSGVGTPVDLVANTSVGWTPGRNGIVVNEGGLAISSSPPAKFYDTVIPRNAFSIEIWGKLGADDLGGPARWVTFSLDTALRNYTFGVERDDIVIRQFGTLNTADGDEGNGAPYITARDVIDLEEHHWVMTFDGVEVDLYRDGELIHTAPRPTSLENWDRTYQLGIGNEVVDDRQWLGEIYLVAGYGRALTPAEVQQNFQAGSDITVP